MKQISHYLVEEPPIGKSEMGFIYKATDADGNVVAIKEILPEFAEDIEMRFRFNQEMRFLERLDHPSVVKTYESFMLADQYYIIMELVNGKNIEQYVAENGVMSENKAIKLMIQILEVMDYVHQQGIVHRDIKPSNIMVQPDGQVKVLGFGIAKDMNSNGHTQVGAVIESDGYMSPEQAEGMAIGHRSDIYSLGCVFFYMVTGHHAYPQQSSEAQMLMSLEKPFPRIKQYNSSISKKFQDVLDIATDKNMLRRYSTCLAFKQTLQQIEKCGQFSVRRYEDAQKQERSRAERQYQYDDDAPSCNYSIHPSFDRNTQETSPSRSVFGKIIHGVGSVVKSIVKSNIKKASGKTVVASGPTNYGANPQQPVAQQPVSQQPASSTHRATIHHAACSPGRTAQGRKLVGFLVSYSINPLGVSFNIYEGRNYIGRDASCDICIPEDTQMSSRHMSILYRNVDHKFKFRDEQSSNGTIVNKQLLDDGELENYDIIHVGSTLFVFVAIPQIG